MPHMYAQVSVRLSSEEMAALDKAVAASGLSRNAAIRRVLVDWATAHQPATAAERPAKRRRVSNPVD
jgi:hypothetical protein